MALPEKNINQVQTNPNDANTIYDIVPKMMTDGDGIYKAELPTLTKDSKIALEENLDYFYELKSSYDDSEIPKIIDDHCIGLKGINTFSDMNISMNQILLKTYTDSDTAGHSEFPCTCERTFVFSGSNIDQGLSDNVCRVIIDSSKTLHVNVTVNNFGNKGTYVSNSAVWSNNTGNIVRDIILMAPALWTETSTTITNSNSHKTYYKVSWSPTESERIRQLYNFLDTFSSTYMSDHSCNIYMPIYDRQGGDIGVLTKLEFINEMLDDNNPLGAGASYSGKSTAWNIALLKVTAHLGYDTSAESSADYYYYLIVEVLFQYNLNEFILPAFEVFDNMIDLTTGEVLDHTLKNAILDKRDLEYSNRIYKYLDTLLSVYCYQAVEFNYDTQPYSITYYAMSYNPSTNRIISNSYFHSPYIPNVSSSDEGKMPIVDNSGNVTWINGVTGVKGNSETNYRTGQVNITKTNIGLSNVTNDKQVKAINSSTNNHIVAFSGTTGAEIKDTGVVISTATVTASSTDTQIPTAKAVWTAIDNLPEPMVFRGSLGSGGTISALPIDGTATIGDTYKVITAGTYAGQAAKIGDTFICDSKTSSANTWVLIPSGDEPSGTVTSVAVAGGTGLTTSGGPITSSGTITVSVASGYKLPTTTEWGNKVNNTITVTGSGALAGGGALSSNQTITHSELNTSGAKTTSGLYKVKIDKYGHITEAVLDNAVVHTSSTVGLIKNDGTIDTTQYTTNTGTVTSVATSGTGLRGGTITTSGTITLDSSAAGNAAANKVVLRNAAGSIQSEKIAISSGTTTKATMQYNSTDDCIDFIFS